MHRMTLGLAAAGIALAAVAAFAEEGRLSRTCDRAAASPTDRSRPAGIPGVAADTRLYKFAAERLTDVADANDIARLLKTQIASPWNPPAEAVRVNSPTVMVRITLNQDGSLSGEPVLVNSGSSPSQALAKSALLAVRRCAPFKLPAAKYELWKVVEITFDARAGPAPPR